MGTKTVRSATSPQASASLTRIGRLLQFSDSTLPVGSFAFSNGLESAIQTGVVKDTPSLKEFVDLVVRQGARMDGIALLHAHRAVMQGNYEGVLAADQALWRRRVGEEQQMMITRMGKKLAELTLRITDSEFMTQWLDDIKADKTPGCYPVGQGVALANFGASEQEAFVLHQYGIASMVLSAALRLMRVDHNDTQTILFEIQERLDEDYEAVREKSLEDMSVFAPIFDVLVAHHTKTHVRLFMN